MQSVLQGDPRRNLHGHSSANEDTVSRADGTQRHGSSTYISAILEDDEGAPCWTRRHGGLARTQGSVSWSSLVLSPPGSSRAQQNSTRHAFAPQSRAPEKRACARGVGRQRAGLLAQKNRACQSRETRERGGARHTSTQHRHPEYSARDKTHVHNSEDTDRPTIHAHTRATGTRSTVSLPQHVCGRGRRCEAPRTHPRHT